MGKAKHKLSFCFLYNFFCLLFLIFYSSFSFSQTIDTSYFIVKKIEVSGNKITRSHIIFRELEFQTGDTIFLPEEKDLFRSSRENLLNTSLFNFVTIEKKDSSGSILISVVERWYLWPFPLLEIAERDINVWIKNPDFKKINYGIFIDRVNFRGRKESLKFLARTGYDQEIGMAYKIPYLDKKQVFGSAFVFTLSRNHMIPYRSWGNELQYFNDEKNFSLHELNANIQLTCRQGLYFNHIIQFGFVQAKISDSLRVSSPEYFNNQKKFKQFLSVNYRFAADYRDSRFYPMRGHYFEFNTAKYGLGFLGNDNLDILQASAVLKKFIPLPYHFNFSASVAGKISNHFPQPYYLQRGLGYNNQYIRGYEYYVVDGQHYTMFKTNLKYTLISNRTFHLSFIPSEKFGRGYYALYLNLFSDGGYVWDNQWNNHNPLSNLFLYSTGIGIDLVTYYDKVFRIEYSLNHMNESGLFLHFLAPI
ncbi:MAG: hypothetical protein V2A54_00525 [Bacteroidota bacterium]